MDYVYVKKVEKDYHSGVLEEEKWVRSRVTYLKLALASSLDCYTLHDVVQQQRALLLLVVVGEHVEHHGTRRPGLESVQWGTTATLQLQ